MSPFPSSVLSIKYYSLDTKRFRHLCQASLTNDLIGRSWLVVAWRAIASCWQETGIAGTRQVTADAAATAQGSENLRRQPCGGSGPRLDDAGPSSRARFCAAPREQLLPRDAAASSPRLSADVCPRLDIFTTRFSLISVNFNLRNEDSSAFLYVPFRQDATAPF